MNLKRIAAVIEREIQITTRLKWRLIESFYFPITSVIMWGLFTIWSKTFAVEAAFALLAVNMFWSFAYEAQAGSNHQLMEDRWTESIKKILASPLKPEEYLIGKLIPAIVLSALSFSISVILAYSIFKYSLLLDHLGYIAILCAITLASSVGISILVAAFVTVVGNEYGFLAWSTMQIFVLFSAPFFPVSVYPFPLQIISRLIPYTWVFESIRSLSLTGSIPSSYLIYGIILSGLLFSISIPIYIGSYQKARKSGKLVKIW